MILLQNGSRDPKLYNWHKADSVSIFSICTAPLQESVQSHPKVFKVTPLFKATPVVNTERLEVPHQRVAAPFSFEV